MASSFKGVKFRASIIVPVAPVNENMNNEKIASLFTASFKEGGFPDGNHNTRDYTGRYGIVPGGYVIVKLGRWSNFERKTFPFKSYLRNWKNIGEK